MQQEQEDRGKWYGFLLRSMGDLIDCCEDAELIGEEISLASDLWGYAVGEDMQDDSLWLQAAVKAKSESRGGARQSLAVVLAWRLSNSGQKDEARRAQLLEKPHSNWLEPQELIGTYLTEIDVCRLIRGVRCSCQANCKGIKFSRDWKKIERGRGELLAVRGATASG